MNPQLLADIDGVQVYEDEVIGVQVFRCFRNGYFISSAFVSQDGRLISNKNAVPPAVRAFLETYINMLS